MTEGHRVSRVVGVRLNEMQPLRFFRTGEQDLEVGDLVLVDTEDGPRRGRVVIAPGQVVFSALTGPVDTILGRLDE
jgi:cell fate regulator YaaT (PSP1 superfamily)